MMRQKIINARVTFHKSPIHVLERFTIHDMQDAYRQFRTHSNLDECVIIQTCNRVELFARSDSEGADRIRRTWASLTGLDESTFNENLETAEGYDALHHLLKLTSGLDSMVLGEEQILGQIKSAIATARESRSSGRHLNTLFEKAVRIGTRIRNSTGIGRGGVSVGSMAVKLAEENIDNMKSRRILLLGTGEVSTLVAKSLVRRGYAFDVAGRTMGRARAFCESMGGTPVRFETVLSGFTGYDAVFVATTAPYSLVTYERMAQAVSESRNDKENSHRGMMILDMSNPRTVDERVATLAGIKLMNLDQISEMVEKNMAAKADKVKTIEDAIKEEVGVLEATIRRLTAEPIAERVFRNVEELRERELQKALRVLGSMDAEHVKIIDNLTKQVVENILATPINNLRKASERDDSDIVMLANRLFDYSERINDDGSGDDQDNDRFTGTAGGDPDDYAATAHTTDATVTHGRQS